MKINPKKLLLGTANLNTKYGFKSIFINKKKSNEIINHANKKKISGFDISTDYNFINEIKKISPKKKFSISLKITRNTFKNIQSKKELILYLKPVFSLSKKKKIDYILFHHSRDLFTKQGFKIYEMIKYLKKKKKISKIGVSIYDIFEIKKILRKYKIDILQVPLNILDQRFLNSNVLKLFKKKKIELHARSIFLQGIIIDRDIVPKKLKKFKDLKRWYSYLKTNKLNSISENLNFINQQRCIKKIIIGIRSKDHLNKILNTNFFVKKNYNRFKSLNTKLIDPRKW